MSRIEKRLTIDFKELVIYPLYAEIAPEIFQISEQNIKQFNHLEENLQDYLAANPIKVIEKDGKYTIVNGISQYLKLAGNTKKVSVVQVLKQKHSNEVFVASDILTSDLFLWHLHAEKVYAQVMGYLQDRSSIAKEVEKLTYLHICQFDTFIRGVSIFSRAKYYELKKVDTGSTVAEKVVAFIGTLPLKFLNGNTTSDFLEINFDENMQFISAQIKNENTESDITSKVTIKDTNGDSLGVTLSHDIDHVIKIQFIKHLDFIRENHRLIFFFSEEELSHGALCTDGVEKTITLSETGHVMLDGKAFGTISLDHNKYVLNTFKKSRLESDVKHILLTPFKVQS